MTTLKELFASPPVAVIYFSALLVCIVIAFFQLYTS